MFLTILTFLTAIAISAVAAYFSIVGLVAIFAAAPIPVAVMGTTLEVAKLVTASWVYRNWHIAPVTIRTYLVTSIIILSLITSMGIFGYLSKAHIDKTVTTGDNVIVIQQLDQKIERERQRIRDAELVTSQLDKAVQVLLDNNRIRGKNGAIATRESQKSERQQLLDVITDANKVITELQEQRTQLKKKQLIFEADLGPLRYITEFIYGKADEELLNKAVRWVIVTLIFVFDPLAILLLIASNITLRSRNVQMIDSNLVGVPRKNIHDLTKETLK